MTDLRPYVVGAMLAIFFFGFGYYFVISSYWTIRYWLDRRADRQPKNYNPLLRYPRNKPCFCGSGLKFKNCHVHLVKLEVSKQAADDIRELMGDL